MTDFGWAMQPITKGCRAAHKQLRCKSDGIELCDLVQSSAERVFRYLQSGHTMTEPLVFVMAKQTSLEYVRRWRKHGRRSRGDREWLPAPKFEADPDPHLLQRATPTPPIELMIDLLDALIGMRLVDAYCWVTCQLHDDPFDAAAKELGYSRSSMKSIVMKARRRLRERMLDYQPTRWDAEQSARKLIADGIGLRRVGRRLGMSPARVRAIAASV